MRKRFVSANRIPVSTSMPFGFAKDKLARKAEENYFCRYPKNHNNLSGVMGK
jgi:hypothetical protein